MATHYKTQAIVFRKNDRNESDRVFSVFTDDFGRLDIFAKAIRKPASKLRSGIDFLSLSDVEFIQGKNRKTLTDAVAIEKFKNIANDPKKFSIACGIGEILDNLIRGEEKHKDIFDLISEVFRKLDNDLKSQKSAMAYYYFLWNVLSLLGHAPHVHKCNSCQLAINQRNIYFSNKSGGVVCESCLGREDGAEKINDDVVKILRLIFKKDWDTLFRLNIGDESKKLFAKTSKNYYSYILSSYSAASI